VSLNDWLLKIVPFETLDSVFYSHSIATMAVLAVSTQCTNVTAIQPDRHRTTAKAALMHSVGRQNCRKCEGQHELLGCRLEMRGLQEQREKLHECLHRSLLATSVLAYVLHSGNVESQRNRVSFFV